jgi:hypothetical protein
VEIVKESLEWEGKVKSAEKVESKISFLRINIEIA